MAAASDNDRIARFCLLDYTAQYIMMKFAQIKRQNMLEYLGRDRDKKHLDIPMLKLEKREIYRS